MNIRNIQIAVAIALIILGIVGWSKAWVDCRDHGVLTKGPFGEPQCVAKAWMVKP